jgi:bifunctional NMN adenylyltransferase/nudix hydrolase
LFPQWSSVDVEIISRYLLRRCAMRICWVKRLNCTFITTKYTAVFGDFLCHEQYKNLASEAEFIAQYKKAWSVAPYTPTFVTTLMQ